MPRKGQPRTPRGGGGGGGGRRGASRGGRGRGNDGNFNPFTSFAGTNTSIAAPNGGHALTLAEEARNTAGHNWGNSDAKLRFSHVKFVSAGVVDPLESTRIPAQEPGTTQADVPLKSLSSNRTPLQELGAEVSLAGMTLESAPEDLDIIVQVEEEVFERESVPMPDAHIDEESVLQPPAHPVFVLDARGSTPIHTGLPPPKIRDTSPMPSDSSEEVILFTGRKNPGPVAQRQAGRAVTINDPIDAKMRLVDDKLHEQKELLEGMLKSKGKSKQTNHHSSNDATPPDFEAILPIRNKRAPRPSRRGKRIIEQAEEEALIADYMANMDSDSGLPLNTVYNQRELGGTSDELWVDETEVSSQEISQPSAPNPLGEWDPSDVADFDDLATSDGVVGKVQSIMSKRDRISGVQYLVVYEDQTMDEARWVHAHALMSVTALNQIQEFETEEKLFAELNNAGEDSTDSDDTDLDEDEHDDQDLMQRRIDRMSDEKIARLLEKQEQLGMGSSELLLFDDTADADEEDITGPASAWSTVKKPKSRGSKSSRANTRSKGDFPAASALADAYDGFDVMDFDRPSLQKKPKGRKGKLHIDLSDSELEASMQDASDNDRIKKKERKQEREDLRALGLLGKKKGKPDLKQKYQEGMGFHDVKEEIKNFLIYGDEELFLPPLDKADRKLIHDIANAFGLKSKSHGDGKNRRPVLYRTKNTQDFVERTWTALEQKLTRRYLPRMDRGSAAPKRGGRGGRGGGHNSAVSYMDGDVVGGNAPALGVESKGYSMMEKMGWGGHGNGLGAENNKGITQPVTHIVKTTKSGLG